MNHSTDDHSQNVNAQASPSTESSSQEDRLANVRETEANIRRPTANRANQSISPSSNFDAFDFASRSSFERTDEFGEADPYVNPAEQPIIDSVSAIETTDYPKRAEVAPAKTIDEILQKLSGYQSEIESCEANEENLQEDLNSELMTEDPSDSSRLTGPEVEVIAASEANHSKDRDNDSIAKTRSNWEQLYESIQVDSTPVDSFSDATGTENLLVPNDQPEACSQETAASSVIPLVNALDADDPGCDEAVFDVRDFKDASYGVIEQIPGTQEVEPDFFEFNVVERKADDGDATPAHPPSKQSTATQLELSAEITRADIVSDLQSTFEQATDPNVEDKVFVADNGDVIQIDGDDGFGFIDLACFDIRLATIHDRVIKINAEEGTVFEIHHRNIPYALFADGVEVDLTPDEPDGQIKEN